MDFAAHARRCRCRAWCAASAPRHPRSALAATPGRLLTQAAHEEIGAVAVHCMAAPTRLFDGLPPTDQQMARRLLVRLVSVADNISLSTRRRVLLHAAPG